MKRRFFPAVLERGPKGTFGAWFPDFPGCVAGGRSQQEAIERAEDALAQAVDALAEHDRPLPEPTPVEAIALPKGCDLVAYFIVGVDPPDPSERVNVYLPKSLLARADRHAVRTRHEPLQLLSGSRSVRRLATMPRFAIMVPGRLGGAALQGAQGGWTARRKVAGQKTAAISGARCLLGRAETQHAVGRLRRQPPLDQHVIDMRDQLAGGKAHLVLVQHVLVEHDRHEVL